MRNLIFIVLVFYSVASFPSGTIETSVLDSNALGVNKRYKVFLPEGYEQSNQSFPVIYQLHGWGANEGTWTSPELDIQAKADKRELNAIIVMPDGDRSMYIDSIATADFEACMSQVPPRPNSSEPRSHYCVESLQYESYIIDDLIPHIDSSYRTVANKKGRAISGESMGGFGAMQLALRNPDVFSSSVSHSGFLSLLYDGTKPFVPGQAGTLMTIDVIPGRREVEEVLGYSIQRWQQYDPYSLLDTAQKDNLAIYFDCGSEDEFGAYESSLHFREKLLELGIAHTFVSVPGGHHDDAQFSARVGYGLEFHEDSFRSNDIYPDAEAN